MNQSRVDDNHCRGGQRRQGKEERIDRWSSGEESDGDPAPPFWIDVLPEDHPSPRRICYASRIRHSTRMSPVTPATLAWLIIDRIIAPVREHGAAAAPSSCPLTPPAVRLAVSAHYAPDHRVAACASYAESVSGITFYPAHIFGGDGGRENATWCNLEHAVDRINRAFPRPVLDLRQEDLLFGHSLPPLFPPRVTLVSIDAMQNVVAKLLDVCKCCE